MTTDRALLGILAIAVLVRVPALGVQSFWSDEGFTVKIATAHLGSAVSQIPNTESTPPLYYAVAWIWAHLFGSSEFVLRLPSAVFGCVTVAAVYWVGVALVTRRVALIAAALTAVSPIMVWYSQEARAYALFVLLSVLALGFFVRALLDYRRASLIGWAVCSAAAVATHYFALFPFLAQGLWLLLRVRERRQVLLALLLPLAACAALAPLAVYQQHHASHWWTSAFTVTDEWKAIVQSFLVGIKWTPVTHRLGVAVLALLALAAAIVLGRRGNREERHVGLALGLLAAVTLLLPTFVSIIGSNYLGPRNVLYAWPILAVIFALGAGRRNAGQFSAAGLAAGCAVSLAIVIAVPLTPGLQREDWRGFLQPFRTASAPRALVLADAFDETPLVEHYLRNVRRPQLPTQVQEVDVIGFSQQQIAHAAELLPRGLRLASQNVGGTLVVSRYKAARPIAMPPSPPPGSTASILVQTPLAHR